MRLRLALVFVALLTIGLGAAAGLHWVSPRPAVATGVQTIVGGGEHSCVILSGGQLRCWGSNAQGQIGDSHHCGSVCDQPVSVTGLTSGVSAVGAGGLHTCAVPSEGDLRCWGANTFGQLGDNTFVNRQLPTAVCGDYNLFTQRCVAQLTGVVQIAGGDDHTCALLNNGSVQCWGSNASGQLGEARFCDPGCPLPMLVSGMTANVIAIASGAHHTCALINTGVVKCWGNNDNGQLGNGTHIQHDTPVDVCATQGQPCPPVLSGAVALAAGGNRTCALMNDGRVRCWGDNRDASLTSTRVCSEDCTAPAEICAAYNNAPDPAGCAQTLTNVTQITMGVRHSCLLRSMAVMCWGRHELGQLGASTTRCIQLLCTVPVEVCSDVDCSASLTGVSGVAAGWYHTCALIAGDVKCWGLDNTGQLGNDNAPPILCQCRKAPVAVVNVKGGPTPTRTRTATRTATLPPGVTPSPTGTPTRTATLPPAVTPSPTVTPTHTATLPPPVTPSPTDTFTPTTTATPTSTPTRTPTATATSARTPTRTPTAPPLKPCGDVNDDGAANSIDAALMLQLDSGRVSQLENAASGDLNGDGAVNSVDAAIVLQFVAGLLSSLEC